MRGDRLVRDVCREHDVAEALYYSWRDRILEGGKAALARKDERRGEKELQKKIRELERALGRKTYELESAREALRMSRASSGGPAGFGVGDIRASRRSDDGVRGDRLGHAPGGMVRGG